MELHMSICIRFFFGGSSVIYTLVAQTKGEMVVKSFLDQEFQSLYMKSYKL